jgi:hypothetical protein
MGGFFLCAFGHRLISSVVRLLPDLSEPDDWLDFPKDEEIIPIRQRADLRFPSRVRGGF